MHIFLLCYNGYLNTDSLPINNFFTLNNPQQPVDGRDFYRSDSLTASLVFTTEFIYFVGRCNPVGRDFPIRAKLDCNANDRMTCVA